MARAFPPSLPFLRFFPPNFFPPFPFLLAAGRGLGVWRVAISVKQFKNGGQSRHFLGVKARVFRFLRIKIGCACGVCRFGFNFCLSFLSLDPLYSLSLSISLSLSVRLSAPFSAPFLKIATDPPALSL